MAAAAVNALLVERMTEPWLTIVGIGADGLDGLGRQARDALAAAEVLVGGSRHLAMLPEDGRPRLAWRSPLADTLPELLALRPRPVAVLATGDPLWYGVGRLLLRHVPRRRGQDRAARLGLPGGLQPAGLGAWRRSTRSPPTAARSTRLRRHLQPGRRLLVLTADGAAPAAIGRCSPSTATAPAGSGSWRNWAVRPSG